MSKRTLQIIFSLLTSALIVGLVQGDTLILRKKETKTNQPIKIEGKILEQDKDKVVIETYPGTTRTILRKDISQITKGKAPWEIYEEEKKKIKDTAKDHYNLGKWCDEHNLKKEARTEWEKAVELDPDFEKARKALGYIKDDSGKWRPEREVMKEKGMVRFEGKWIPKDKFVEAMKKGGYAFSLKIAIEEDVDDDFMKEMATRMQQASEYLWKCSRGQFYLGEVIITDKTSKGTMIVPKGYAHSSEERFVRSVVGGKGAIGTFYLPGRVSLYTFLHEFGHAAFGLWDEKAPNNLCRICVMRGPQKDGDPQLDPQWCSSDNHTAKGPSCWDRILEQWPNLVGPNNEPDESKPPDTEVKIVNN